MMATIAMMMAMAMGADDADHHHHHQSHRRRRHHHRRHHRLAHAHVRPGVSPTRTLIPPAALAPVEPVVIEMAPVEPSMDVPVLRLMLPCVNKAVFLASMRIVIRPMYKPMVREKLASKSLTNW
jgi:hypothetical protein